MNSTTVAFVSASARRVITGVCAVALCTAPALAALHPGDKVSVVVFNHPELSSSATITARGDISLPVAGTVPSQGLEPDQLANRIRDRLAPYVKMVAVRVSLDAQSESIFVAGGPSGVLKYQPGETLVSIVDQLQFSPQQRTQSPTNPRDQTQSTAQQVSMTPLDIYSSPVDFKRVSVLRDKTQLGPFDVLALRSAGQPGIALEPDDTVQLVNKPIAVTVRGEVNQPGTAFLDPEDPLARAIDQVGGTGQTSSQTAITLVRNGTSQIVSLGNSIFTAPAVNGDQLVVPRAPRVDVLGTVARPGETYLRGNQTLVSAIYYAGGPDRYANLKSVSVVHNGVKSEYNLARIQKGHQGDNPMLADGDVVFVPQGSTLDAATIFQAIGALGFIFR